MNTTEKLCKNCIHPYHYGYTSDSNGKRIFTKKDGFSIERGLCGAPKAGQMIFEYFKCSNGKFEKK